MPAALIGTQAGVARRLTAAEISWHGFRTHEIDSEVPRVLGAVNPVQVILQAGRGKSNMRVGVHTGEGRGSALHAHLDIVVRVIVTATDPAASPHAAGAGRDSGYRPVKLRYYSPRDAPTKSKSLDRGVSFLGLVDNPPFVTPRAIQIPLVMLM